MSVPDNLKYTDHDEWVRVEGNIAVIGITDFAQGELGELVHVEMPEVGDELDAGDAVCEVEAVKAVAEVYTPVAGKVVEVNEALDGSEETINNDPYGEGWIVKIEMSDTAGLDSMLDAAAYQSKLDS